MIRVLFAATGLVAGFIAPAPAAAGAAPFDQSATTIDDVLALGRPIVLAHNGGEDVHPSGTLFAFGESMKAGVDMLDLNVQLTADGVLVVQHDLDVARTTNGEGRVLEMTFQQLHALDNAYFFTTGCGVCADEPAEAYLYRGIRTGEVAPPAGYTADDFAMPRLEDVLETFPDIPLSIEIKDNGDRARAIADSLVAVLRDRDRLDSVVIASFEDVIVEYVHELAPEVDVTSLSTSVFHLLEGRPIHEFTRVVQPSARFEQRPVFTAESIAADHDAGRVVWVWPNERIYENAEAYTALLAIGVDGINANDPDAAVAAVEAFVSGQA